MSYFEMIKIRTILTSNYWQYGLILAYEWKLVHYHDFVDTDKIYYFI